MNARAEEVEAAIAKENARIKREGGPAFPEAIAVGPAGDVYPGMSGMTLRQWYAGQAPVDWDAARQAAGLDITVSPDGRKQLWAAMAVLRYEYADAMIAEGGKP